MNALSLLALLAASEPSAVIDSALASRIFQEARLASEADGGKLWGKPLYGPLLLVDPKTLTIVTNQPDREGKLAPAGDVFVGRLPAGTMVANTSMSWAGVTWAMVIWPLPGSAVERVQLVLHESWHRIQGQIGLPAGESPNSHLDTFDGRYLLRLELRALQAALRADDPTKLTAIADALTFRAARHKRFPGAATAEARLEVHEGLAEYTGVKLRGTPERETRRALADHLAGPAPENFTRTFAYLTGPAYGLLLDSSGGPWRGQLTAKSDLSSLLGAAVGFTAPDDLQLATDVRAGVYGGKSLLAEEQQRERDRVRRFEEYRTQLVTGPVLELPLGKFNMVMNPKGVMPLGEFGTVYPTLTLKGEWGILTATQGARIAADFKHAYVRAPNTAGDRLIEDRGWKLELNEGWRIVSGKRAGDFLLVPAAK